MKQLLILILLVPCIGFAQSRADYDKFMEKFVRLYNTKQSDSLVNMWKYNEEFDEWTRKVWSNDKLTEKHKEYGKIIAYKYLGIDTEDPSPGLAVYETNFSVVGWKTTSFTIDSGYLSTFRPITSSKGIDKLLKNKKGK